MGKWTKLMPDGNGGYDAFDWNLDAEIGANIGGLLIMVFAGILFCLAIPFIMIFIYPGSIARHRMSYLIIGAIGSLWVLVDYHFGWYLWGVFTKNYQEIYDVLIPMYGGFFIFFISLLFFDEFIIGVGRALKMPVLIFWVYTFFIMKMLFMPMAGAITPSFGYEAPPEVAQVDNLNNL